MEEQIGTDQSRALAAAIGVLEPLTWSGAGQHLLDIIEAEFNAQMNPTIVAIWPELGDHQRELVESGVESSIKTTVKTLDDEFEWDWPRMSEASEDYFLDWIVQGRVRQLFEQLT